MANAIIDEERGLPSRTKVEVFRFVKPDGTQYELEFKGELASTTAEAWARVMNHKLISASATRGQERPSPPPPTKERVAVTERSPQASVQATPITPTRADVADSDNKKRAIEPEAKALNRSAILPKPTERKSSGADAATDSRLGVAKPNIQQPNVALPDVPSGPKYWAPEKGTYRIVLDGYKFDFHPTGNGSQGTIEGRRVASGHDGRYSITKNGPGSFQMSVRIGTTEKPTEDLDVILFISGSDAKVAGTMQGKTADQNKTARVRGDGTESKPFEVQFPDAKLEWYPLN